jgi:hypothetical protein
MPAAGSVTVKGNRVTVREQGAPRKSRVLVWVWSALLLVLLVMGLCAWFIVLPFWETHRVLSRITARRLLESQYGGEIERLGGKEEAATRLGSYLRQKLFGEECKPAAIDLLQRCGKPAVPVIVEVLTYGKPELRVRAAKASGWLPTRDMVPSLASNLGHEDKRVREACYDALYLHGRAARGSLLEALSSGNWHTRGLAAELLGKMDPFVPNEEIMQIRSRLQDLSKSDKRPEVRGAAEAAVKGIDDDLEAQCAFAPSFLESLSEEWAFTPEDIQSRGGYYRILWRLLFLARSKKISEDQRLLAVRLMAKCGPRSQSFLATAAKVNEKKIRDAALKAMAALNDTKQ